MATEQRTQYWGALHSARKEYTSDIGDNAGMVGSTFPHWMEQKYGLRMGLDGSGNYTQEYSVSNPKRFLLFRLKYMK
jgi:hypothetical protein